MLILTNDMIIEYYLPEAASNNSCSRSLRVHDGIPTAHQGTAFGAQQAKQSKDNQEKQYEGRGGREKLKNP